VTHLEVKLTEMIDKGQLEVLSGVYPKCCANAALVCKQKQPTTTAVTSHLINSNTAAANTMGRRSSTTYIPKPAKSDKTATSAKDSLARYSK